jgi:tRNA(fMet)-specific endonuclease VapC
MSYLLDTDICVYWLKGHKVIEQKALSVGLEEITISFITLSELYYGSYKSVRVDANLANINIIKDKLRIVESSDKICETFGKLKASLEKVGKIIDDADLFIAACALVNNVTLVTNNEKHFRRIRGLQVENWLKLPQK